MARVRNPISDMKERVRNDYGIHMGEYHTK